MAAKTKFESRAYHADYLTALFETIEPAFRERTVARFRQVAQDHLARWSEKLAGEPALPSQKRPGSWETPYYEKNRMPHYVKFDKSGCPERPHSASFAGDQGVRDEWAWLRECEARGAFSADLEAAEADANQCVDDAKAHFVAKQSEKLQNACGERTITLTGSLRADLLAVTGALRAECENGDCFVLELSIIVNRRHEPRYIEFYQFPARFAHVVLGGEEHRQAGEAWMAEHFAGVKKDERPRRYEVRPVERRYGKFVVIDLETGEVAPKTYAYNGRGAATRIANKLEAVRV